MNGARDYARLFGTGQYGRLFIVSGSHARGSTFHIFVLPEGEKAIPNGPSNGPLNRDAVEVYGVVGGNRGWTESYGWLHHGKWESDFDRLVEAKKQQIVELNEKQLRDANEKASTESQRVQSLLATY